MSDNKDVKKFTKGEICIFFHIVATLALTLVLIIVYFVHMCLVKHSPASVLSIGRRSAAAVTPGHDIPQTLVRVGALYLNGSEEGRVLCSTLLLHPQWSLTPAHCAAARADPDLASLLPLWMIRYFTNNSDPIDTAVKRSIPHPHFTREDFRNNIGLLQHESDVATEYDYFKHISTLAIDESYFSEQNVIELVGHYQYDVNDAGSLIKKRVKHLPRDSCSSLVTPVTNLRPYEHCFVPTNEDFDSCFDHGASLVVNSKSVGFFTWSEKCGNKMFPFIVTSINEYKDWLQHISISHL